MSDQFLAEIRIVPFNFAPNGWALCNGQILPISQNTALFSLVGTQYGGNGTSNFGLPNLQGNAAMDYGSGTGLTSRFIGETGGEASVTLIESEIPAHSHGLNADTSTATSASPAGRLLAVPAVNPRIPHQLYSTTTATASPMLAGNLLPTGGDQPHNNMMPYLVLNFVISMTGIFPARQ
jgi:microcystin-dependent protein